jgi:hypothetical protein
MKRVIAMLIVFGCVGLAGAKQDFSGNEFTKYAINETSYTETADLGSCLATSTVTSVIYLDRVLVSSAGLNSYLEVFDSSFTSTLPQLGTSTGKLLLRLDTRAVGEYNFHIQTTSAPYYNNAGDRPAKIQFFFNRGR